MKDAGKKERDHSQAQPIEWAIGIVCAFLVLAIIGFLGWQGLTHSDEPPELTIIAEGMPTAVPGQLRFRVRNSGGRAASAVVVSAIARDQAGMETVRARLTIDYVAPGSDVSGAFMVEEGPEVELIVEGYLDP
jgi:uncharacterized protein (TIGR02588 family)